MAIQIEIPACRIKKIEILRSIVVIYICGTGGVFMKNIDIHGMTNMELIRGESPNGTGQRTIFTAISMRQKNYSDRDTLCGATVCILSITQTA